MSSDPHLRHGRHPDDEPPRWVRIWWPPAGRLVLLLVGAGMAWAGPTEAHTWAGSGLMLAAVGIQIASWPGWGGRR